MTGREEWYFDDAEVARICESTVKKLGPKTAQIILEIFKKFDKSKDPISLTNIEPQELRRKVRHICKAYNLNAVDFETVSGTPSVVTSFRKPKDCQLKLAKSLKGFLVKAISHEATNAATAELAVRAEDRTKDETTDPMLQAARDRAKAERQSAAQEAEKKVEGSTAVMCGIMTLEEYENLKYKQDEEQSANCEYLEAEADPLLSKSLVELTQEGVFNTNKEYMRKFNEMKNIQKDMWGKSAVQQKRIETKRTRLQQQLTEKNSNSGKDDEEQIAGAWDHFDRDEISKKSMRLSDDATTEFIEEAKYFKSNFVRGNR